MVRSSLTHLFVHSLTLTSPINKLLKSFTSSICSARPSPIHLVRQSKIKVCLGILYREEHSQDSSHPENQERVSVREMMNRLEWPVLRQRRSKDGEVCNTTVLDEQRGPLRSLRPLASQQRRSYDH